MLICSSFDFMESLSSQSLHIGKILIEVVRWKEAIPCKLQGRLPQSVRPRSARPHPRRHHHLSRRRRRCDPNGFRAPPQARRWPGRSSTDPIAARAARSFSDPMKCLRCAKDSSAKLVGAEGTFLPGWAAFLGLRSVRLRDMGSRSVRIRRTETSRAYTPTVQRGKRGRVVLPLRRPWQDCGRCILNSEIAADEALFAPAAARNRAVILGVLRDVLPRSGGSS